MGIYLSSFLNGVVGWLPLPTYKKNMPELRMYNKMDIWDLSARIADYRFSDIMLFVGVTITVGG
jgi:hypothetical protein